jgi:hypothetical protein
MDEPQRNGDDARGELAAVRVLVELVAQQLDEHAQRNWPQKLAPK